MWVDMLLLCLDGMGLGCRYDAGRARGNVRSGESQWTVATTHSAGRAPGSRPHRVWARAGEIVHRVGALRHGAHWGCAGSRRGGGGDVGGDIDGAETVLERADVNDREAASR